MRPKGITPEVARMIDNEAYRRFRGDPIAERTRTKVLAVKTGMNSGTLANLIAEKRREYERKVNVTVEKLTQRPADELR